ncbi:MAG: PHP domain-containing protein, partial [Actinomycetota bacterium]|nr:PHP domain-containing protein [Actinomycetota bacterium]
MTQEFCHLHLHSEYSILDGASRIADCLGAAKAMGMDSLAITDHGVMYGAISFYRKALELGIKPILGCEVYVAKGEMGNRNGGMAEQPYHLVLLAQNNQGYENLMRIVTLGFTKGFYYKPRVDKEILRELHQGIIALSACLKGEIPSLIVEEDYQKAASSVDEYTQIFGEGNFYLELMDHGIEKQPKVNQALIELSREKGVPLVVTNDIHYVKREDSKAHDVLLC